MEQLSFIKTPIDEYIVECFSADDLCDDSERRNLEKKYSSYLEVTNKFNRQSVSYQLSKKDQLHSWLKYKEGFSADLVNTLLDEMNSRPGDVIMDPFLGSGTTALVCQMRGINSIGYDIMPISDIAIKAKANCAIYDIDEIKKLIADVERMVVPSTYKGKTPYIKITQYAYPEDTEIFLSYIKDWNEKSNYSIETKNLLTLCIINSLEKISYTTKAGQYLGWDSRSRKVILGNIEREKKGKKPLAPKIVREVIPEAKVTIVKELQHVLADIVMIQNNSAIHENADINYIRNSVLFELPKLPDNSINGVITSPPYCNRYDYTRTYALELVYLGADEASIKKMRQELLSCTVESKSKLEEIKEYYDSNGMLERFNEIREIINSNSVFSEIKEAMLKRKENGDLNNTGVVRMVEGYFTELAFIYAELFRICKSGSMVAFVNDNVRYGGEVIPVDFLSCSFAEQFGFSVRKVYCLKQQKGNSSQQMAKFGRVALRKSITVWEKK